MDNRTETVNYNLLEELWIPVLWTDGKVSCVGILDALTKAAYIRQIAVSNPMDRVAIFRFLLALLYYCLGNPPANTQTTTNESFPIDLFSKLNANKEYFNLIGNGKRFYQDSTAKRLRSITDLIQEIPTGNNFWHFRHSTDEVDGLCYPCCARGLLRLPLFSVSGLPDLKAGINGTPPIYVMPCGKTLLETLHFNWTPRKNLGTPTWDQLHENTTTGEDVPLLTGLTLLSRRVWLHESMDRGICVACGATAPIIKFCEFQSAGEQKNERWDDPHVVYSKTEIRKTAKAADLTAAGKFRMDRPWPYLFANMVEAGWFQPRRNGIALLIIGFATDNAKNIDVWERIIELPEQEFEPKTVAPLMVKWQKEGLVLEKRVARSETIGTAAIAAIRPQIEDKVSVKTGVLLSGENAVWEQAAGEYRPMMQVIARSLEPGFTTAAVQERKRIADMLPQMGQTQTVGKKTGKKKRGIV